MRVLAIRENYLAAAEAAGGLAERKRRRRFTVRCRGVKWQVVEVPRVR